MSKRELLKASGADRICPEQLAKRPDEASSRVDVELGRKPDHLLAEAQVHRDGAGVVTDEITELVDQGLGE